MAMPRYAPTEEQRRVVKTMAAYGIPQEAIARVVQCSEPTLRRAYRAELDTAVHEANARVAQCLYQQATTPGNVAASIFWLKARAGWREKQTVDTGDAPTEPMPTNLVVTFREAPSRERNTMLIEGERV
jgi:hypothetical protein